MWSDGKHILCCKLEPQTRCCVQVGLIGHRSDGHNGWGGWEWGWSEFLPSPQDQRERFSGGFTCAASQICCVIYSHGSCSDCELHVWWVLKEVQVEVGHILEQDAGESFLYLVQNGLQDIATCCGKDEAWHATWLPAKWVRRRLCVTRGPTSIHHQVACWRCVGLAGEDACGKSARMLLPQRLCQWQFLTLFCMRATAPKIAARLVVCALVCILGCTTWTVLNDCKRTRGVLQRARKNWVCMPRPLRMRPLSITVPV